MTDVTQPVPDQPLVAADGTPLKRKLEQALFVSRMRALGLVAPLLAFILAVFVIPIIYFMIQGFYNPLYERNMPRSAALLQEWDGRSPVTEEMAAAMVADLKEAREKRTIGRVATRVNQEFPGTRSLFTSTARKAKRMKPPYLEALIKANRKWGDIEVWRAIKVAATSWTPAYYLAALDLQYRGDGTIVQQSEDRRIYRQLFLRTLTRHRTGMLGLYGVLFMLLLTMLTPLIAPFDPDMVDVGTKNLPPGGAYWMGTDGFGRDVFSRLLFGGRISLMIGFIAVSIAATMGTTIGALAAFAGGTVDRVLMFLTDGLIALPKLVLLLTIVGLFRLQGPWGIFLIIAILGATGWMGVARIVRSQVLSLKQQEFVQAAQALGLSSTRILFRHLIPNALAPVIVYCSLAIGSTMLAEAGLSFLGLGVPPPTSTWGVMVADGKDALRNAPHVAIFPGLAIMVAVLSFNLLGDGLRDALDPKLRGH